HGTTHLSAGQEAVPVGVCMALEPDDYVSGTYRGHGHALAKGTDPEALAAEMLGRATGVCGGRAGSMNVVDLERGLVGCFGVVDGNDLWAVRDAAVEAVDRARQGGGPTLLECRTYRHFGHSKSDPGKYRPADEVEGWLQRDPLTIARERLLAERHSEEDIAAAETHARDRIEAAVEAARAAPFPDPASERASEYSR